jgi:hypothetical protein
MSHRSSSPKGRAVVRRAAVALAASLVMLLVVASSASALNYAMNFRNYDPSQLEFTKASGATVFRTELDFTCTAGGSNWGQFDPIVEAAWKQGITILPILVRTYPACEASGPGTHKRFLNSGDGNWGNWWSWSKAAVERYGINGSFWSGKANPTPITAWEVGNEPNLPANNPGGAVVQPQAYGEFLSYTANALQAGSVAKTAHGTEVISAGLYMPGGYDFNQFLANMGHTNAYTAVGIHPYSFRNGATGVAEEINSVRNTLNNKIPGGSGKALWITEIGWNVGGIGGMPSGTAPLDEPTQAARLNESFDWIQTHAGANDKNIALLTWYKIQDQSPIDPLHPNEGNWDEHTGLRRFDGSLRPAWRAFQEQVGAPVSESPATETRPATEITETRAKLNGWVHPHNLPTSYWFDYGTTTAYGSSVPMPRGSASGPIGVWIGAEVGGLKPGTTYYYRVVAVNAMGTSITAESSFRTPETVVAFQANNATLWTYSTASGYFNTTLGMKAGTSPSISQRPDGSYSIAFQASDGKLWTYSSSSGYFNTTLGMMAGTSPSIAARSDGGYVVAFQANNGTLWTYSTASGYFNTTLGMKAGTSPSIAQRSDGTYAVAFQASDGKLWTFSPPGSYFNTTLGMRSETSPSIAVAADGGYKEAFESDQSQLWTYSAAGGFFNTTLGMAAGTSPSLSVR